MISEGLKLYHTGLFFVLPHTSVIPFACLTDDYSASRERLGVVSL